MLLEQLQGDLFVMGASSYGATSSHQKVLVEVGLRNAVGRVGMPHRQGLVQRFRVLGKLLRDQVGDICLVIRTDLWRVV